MALFKKRLTESERFIKEREIMINKFSQKDWNEYNRFIEMQRDVERIKALQESTGQNVIQIPTQPGRSDTDYCLFSVNEKGKVTAVLK